eukprot:GHVS01018595.1.p2 GENE.GHVS01018595.1~~GHVS01018595.1.p2  ORF type:complete len:224 (+),score=87.28 GHVS01018595.1:1533-2204(+)
MLFYRYNVFLFFFFLCSFLQSPQFIPQVNSSSSSICTDFHHDQPNCSSLGRCTYSGNNCVVDVLFMDSLLNSSCLRYRRGDVIATARDMHRQGILSFAQLHFIRSRSSLSSICLAVAHPFFAFLSSLQHNSLLLLPHAQQLYLQYYDSNNNSNSNNSNSNSNNSNSNKNNDNSNNDNSNNDNDNNSNNDNNENKLHHPPRWSELKQSERLMWTLQQHEEAAAV